MRTVVRRKERSATRVKCLIYLTFIGSCWLIITYELSLSLFGCSLLYTGFLQHPCKLCGDDRELYLPVPSWFLWATLRRRSANILAVSLNQQVTSFCQFLYFLFFSDRMQTLTGSRTWFSLLFRFLRVQPFQLFLPFPLWAWLSVDRRAPSAMPSQWKMEPPCSFVSRYGNWMQVMVILAAKGTMT